MQKKARAEDAYGVPPVTRPRAPDSRDSLWESKDAGARGHVTGGSPTILLDIILGRSIVAALLRVYYYYSVCDMSSAEGLEVLSGAF